MNYMAKATSYMIDEDEEGNEIQTDEIWITQGKAYDLKPAEIGCEKCMCLIDDSGHTHYVSKEVMEEFFIKLDEKDGKQHESNIEKRD